MNEQERIGTHIARARKLRGMRQVELGAAIGVSDQTISNWEVGLRSPRADYVRRMCDVLDCSADYLLGLSDQIMRAPSPARDEDPSPADANEGFSF